MPATTGASLVIGTLMPSPLVQKNNNSAKKILISSFFIFNITNIQAQQQVKTRDHLLWLHPLVS
jgi:hypothetical protein